MPRRMGGEEMARELQETVQTMSDAEVCWRAINLMP
eukprot:COSAG01_NODE_10153_length_2231_cov_11.508895_2_plen_36_part_00